MALLGLVGLKGLQGLVFGAGFGLWVFSIFRMLGFRSLKWQPTTLHVVWSPPQQVTGPR